MGNPCSQRIEPDSNTFGQSYSIRGPRRVCKVTALQNLVRVLTLRMSRDLHAGSRPYVHCKAAMTSPPPHAASQAASFLGFPGVEESMLVPSVMYEIVNRYCSEEAPHASHRSRILAKHARSGMIY